LHAAHFVYKNIWSAAHFFHKKIPFNRSGMHLIQDAGSMYQFIGGENDSNPNTE